MAVDAVLYDTYDPDNEPDNDSVLDIGLRVRSAGSMDSRFTGIISTTFYLQYLLEYCVTSILTFSF